MKLSVVIPVYYEAATVAMLVDAVRAAPVDDLATAITVLETTPRNRPIRRCWRDG